MGPQYCIGIPFNIFEGLYKQVDVQIRLSSFLRGAPAVRTPVFLGCLEFRDESVKYLENFLSARVF